MFRLRKVREWKELLERQARAERLAVEARATELARDADRLQDERRHFPDEPPPNDDVTVLAAWARRADLLRRQETSVRGRLATLQGELARKRSVHLTLRKEVESLRRLEERRRRYELRVRERKTQEMIDDAAARRFLPGGGRNFPVVTRRPGDPDDPGTDGRAEATPFSPSVR